MAAFRNGNPVTPSQLAQRLREVHFFIEHEELEGITASPASEAIEQLLAAIHIK